jgi:hypothetical protein
VSASPPRRILPAIAVSQFAGASLWFAINAVMADLQAAAALPPDAVGWLTAAVQLGFIAGTFAFALFAIADRFCRAGGSWPVRSPARPWRWPRPCCRPRCRRCSCCASPPGWSWPASIRSA